MASQPIALTQSGVCAGPVCLIQRWPLLLWSPRRTLFIVIRDRNHFFNRIAEKKFYHRENYHHNDITLGYEQAERKLRACLSLSLSLSLSLFLSRDICRVSTSRSVITLIRTIAQRRHSVVCPDYFFLASMLAMFRPLIM